MTLNRQLWLAIVLILVLAFCGTFIVSTLAAKRYIEQELTVKNLDNATSLALSMSQMPKDLVTIELLLAAQFDAGHYRLIRLSDPQGEVLVERLSDVPSTEGGAPAWFIEAFPIEVPPGIAQIQDGWRQFGTLQLETHDRFAYTSLWQGTRQQLMWFLSVALLAGILGTALLRIILRPLDRVVRQAEAIGERQFVTTPEPATAEFRRLVRAMNTLSNRVRDMLTRESGRVEELLRAAQFDAVTGLLKREAFMRRLDSALQSNTKHSTGVMAILRLTNLVEMNQDIGHVATDQLLQAIGERLNRFAGERATRWTVGRLGGTDLGLLAPGETDPNVTTSLFLAEVQSALTQGGQSPEELAVGATSFRPSETKPAVLTRTDAALTASLETGQVVVREAVSDTDSELPTDLPSWRELLEPALQTRHVSLNQFPVQTSSGELLHFECPVRLKVGERQLAAGFFIAWVARLGWIARLDELVIEAALREIRRSGKSIAVNVSAESICHPEFVEALVERMRDNPDLAAKLWLDVPEHGALHHLAEFRSFCMAIKPLRCQLGLKHAGPEFSRIAEMHDLGLHHLKLDSSLCRNIDSDSSHQSFVRGVCTVVHSIGMLAIAEGVSSEAERATLVSLGADALTGPAIKL